MFCFVLLGWMRRCLLSLLVLDLNFGQVDLTSFIIKYSGLLTVYACQHQAAKKQSCWKPIRLYNVSEVFLRLLLPNPRRQGTRGRFQQRYLLLRFLPGWHLSAACKSQYTSSEIGSTLTVHVAHVGRKLPEWRRSVAWLSRSCPEHLSWAIITLHVDFF